MSSRTISIAALVLSAIVVTIGVTAQPAQGFGGLLVAAVFGLMLSLGAATFLALNGVVGARWYRPIVTVPAHIARTMPVPALALALSLMLGLEALYPWARAEVVASSPLLQGKALWLNTPFFLARAILMVVIWLILAGLLRASVRGSTLVPRGLSALFLVALAPTLSVATWDWTMSLEPEWFSTMWAVYGFAGSFVAGIAGVTLVALSLDKRGLLPARLQPSTLHDLGKLLFAFTSFWGYIWFCQYMLIWYANLPEEVTWFANRTTAGWTTLFWLNPILNWAVPFVALMSVRAKKDPAYLGKVALAVLAGRWLDTYLMVGPALGPSPGVPIFAVAATIAVMAGMWLLAPTARSLGGSQPTGA